MFKSKLTIFACVLIVIFLVGANAYGAKITEEFLADEEMATGTIVSISTDKTSVSKAVSATRDRIYGVVASTGDISFNKSESDSHVMVANTGVMPALVSTISGNIEAGDPITVVSHEGIGQKALQAGRIVGIALGELNEETPNAKQTTVTLGDEELDVHIGLIDIKVAASEYTPATTLIDQENKENRNTLERIADNVAGKEVRPIALIVSGLILVTGVFVAIFLISSSSYSSMISIGRNPMARKNILRSLTGLVLLAIAIFFASVALAYGTLRVLG